MGTNTTIMNLFKPATSDLVDVTTDLSNNYDLIDAWATSVAPQSVGSVNTAGTAARFARADHVHAAGASTGLLAVVSYAPATGVQYNPAAAAMAALDSTHLALPSFTVPASGKVLVRQSGFYRCANTAGLRSYVGITVHGSSTLVGGYMSIHHGIYALEGAFTITQEITGLTPGATATWDYGFSTQTAGACFILVSGDPSTGDSGCAATMEVWAV